MILQRIDETELTRIYNTNMVHDFPESELKPLIILIRCMREGSCIPYGLYEGYTLLAYGIMLFNKTGEAGILDYLAVPEGLRGNGYGSEFLRLLRTALAEYSGILIEYEFPDDAEDEFERAMRIRRESFYLRNGVRETRMDLILFGVHFKVGYLPCTRDFSDKELKRMQISVYDRVNCWNYRFLDAL